MVGKKAIVGKKEKLIASLLFLVTKKNIHFVNYVNELNKNYSRKDAIVILCKEIYLFYLYRITGKVMVFMYPNEWLGLRIFLMFLFLFVPILAPLYFYRGVFILIVVCGCILLLLIALVDKLFVLKMSVLNTIFFYILRITEKRERALEEIHSFALEKGGGIIIEMEGKKAIGYLIILDEKKLK